VPRPQLHTPDSMLDAARDLLLEHGLASMTVEAIADTSGAPTGSIYHRFRSRNELIARLWIRAVKRSQERFLDALEAVDPRQAALAGALSIVEFAERERADARLLVSFRREDLIRVVDDELARELEELNRPLARATAALSRGLFGSRSRTALDRTLLATFDLPYGAVRRYLIADIPLPRSLREDMTRAVRAVLNSSHEPERGSR
jgi:AcrR family transcriptional regulator